MRRAGTLCGERALQMLGAGQAAAVFCGSGNNGGDGLRAAQVLHEAGKRVWVLLTGEGGKVSADSAAMLRECEARVSLLEETDRAELAAFLQGCGVVVDAVYGFGFHAPMRGLGREAARLMNGAGAPILAVDIASGVEAGTGLADEDAVQAAVTLTFTTAKLGHFTTPGALHARKVEVADIGIQLPPGTTFDSFAVTGEDISLPPRRRDAHKGDFGRVLIVAGSRTFTGAPSFASRAAVRVGAGLVTLAVPESIHAIEAVKNDEAMVLPLPADGEGRLSRAALPVLLDRLRGADALLIGPGLGRSAEVEEVVLSLLAAARVPVILDADGINALAAHIDRLASAACPLTLTPHEGEFARLGGDLRLGRVPAARAFAQKYGCTLILKGWRTVTALPSGEVFLNTTGNPGMATGGSGDVLAGMLAGLTPQLANAAPAAVWLHGKAGDLAAEEYGEYSMTPSDLLAKLPEVMRGYTKC
ncbi:MAG: NAD(P)H-hydrate dehydratase, partial [bacterium]